MPDLCSIGKCKSWAKLEGLCSTHLAQRQKKLAEKEGAGTSTAPASVPTTKVISKDGYYGGAANQLHVHVIKGDAHVKLGPNKRINIVKDRQRHSGASRIYEELASHPRGPVLKPWVDAAFRFYGV